MKEQSFSSSQIVASIAISPIQRFWKNGRSDKKETRERDICLVRWNYFDTNTDSHSPWAFAFLLFAFLFFFSPFFFYKVYRAYLSLFSLLYTVTAPSLLPKPIHPNLSPNLSSSKHGTVFIFSRCFSLFSKKKEIFNTLCFLSFSCRLPEHRESCVVFFFFKKKITVLGNRGFVIGFWNLFLK